MSIDHKVIYPGILYDCVTIYQYDTGICDSDDTGIVMGYPLLNY